MHYILLPAYNKDKVNPVNLHTILRKAAFSPILAG